VSTSEWKIQDVLRDLTLGGPEAASRRELLFSRLYDELRQVAVALMRKERRDHTLRPTELVHEVYARLVEERQTSWESRAHFFGVAAEAMRQVLVHHARRRNTLKRGAGWHRVTLTGDIASDRSSEFEIFAVHEALEKLAAIDERAARVAEFRLFAALAHRDIAYLLGVSTRTVEGDWALARRWLSRELAGDSPA
jgi:RNA polymerase sigma-70 factor (ECF subfamily)